VRSEISPLAVSACLAVAACNSAGVGALRDNSADTYHQVQNDRGGRVIDYAVRTAKLRESGQQTRLAGRCASACTLYLTLPPEQLCILPGTSFAFHAPVAKSPRGGKTAEQYLFSSYPQWVQAWIESRGGLTSNLLIMSYADASQHLRTCTPHA